MSEHLRHTADHISWLMRQRRREVAETGQLAAQIGRILHRRGCSKGFVGILGADKVREAAGIIQPKPRPPIELPRSETREPPPAPPSDVEEVDMIAQELEEALEAPPGEIEEAAPQSAPEPAPEAVPGREQETAAWPLEAVAPGKPEKRREGAAAEVELHIREAAAEAAAVEGILLEVAEEPSQEAAEAEPAAPEAEGPVKERAVPGMATLGADMPFEAAIEPQRLIPADLAFAQAADEVVFRRAIANLGSGDVRGVREGIEMLGRVPDDPAAAVLMNLYRIAPPRWRPDIAHQLVGHPGAGIAPFFCQVLDDEDEPPVVRVAALRALYSRDRALAADHLLKALGDPDEEVRATAATYLGWLREKRALPLLEQLMGDSAQGVAKAALHAASLIQR